MIKQLGWLLLAATVWAASAFAAEPESKAGPQAEAIAAAHAWWEAFAHGDGERFSALSAPDLSLTLSVGTPLDRAAALERMKQHVGSDYVGATWDEDAIRLAGPDVAIVTSTSTEGFARMRTVYRYLTVLQKQEGLWRVRAAQSTRVLSSTPRVPLAQAGAAAEYAGRYRTPNGQALVIRALADALVMVDPNGHEARLEPIGADLFELDRLQSASGVLRFVFVRDATGKVAALTRLGPQVGTFPRSAD